MSVSRVEYFAQYDNGRPISGDPQLDGIRMSGLEKDLSALGLEKASHGFWVDVPRAKPHPFIGGTQVEFLDDEWLPVTAPGYYVQRSD